MWLEVDPGMREGRAKLGMVLGIAARFGVPDFGLARLMRGGRLDRVPTPQAEWVRDAERLARRRQDTRER
jgi:hypothetical protein